MSSSLPPALAKLIAETPLPDQQKTQRAKLMAGDLAAGAKGYAFNAASYGTHGNWWRVWREIQRHRGLSGKAMFADLKWEGLRWFTLWSLEHGDPEDALIAYPLFLDAETPWSTMPQGPDTGLNILIMRALIERGRDDEALALVEKVSEFGRGLSDERAIAATILARRGQFEAALEMIGSLVRRYHDQGRYWATAAIVQQIARREADAARSVAEAAKLDGHDEKTIDEMLSVLEMSRERWDEMRRPYLSSSDFLEQKRRLLADPGATLEPSDVPTPHCFGGNDFAMPACPGCGHTMHAWFVIDLREIPRLKQKLPSWTRLPMLGCDDCDVQFMRVDYHVDESAMRVTLATEVGRVPLVGDVRPARPPLQRKFARLEWIPPRHDVTDDEIIESSSPEQPRVAGEPDWTQQPLRVFCPTCRGEMAYVAAMANTDPAFDDSIIIVGGSGYHYHFACDGCRTISVIPQCT
jgi:hypothetical protein